MLVGGAFVQAMELGLLVTVAATSFHHLKWRPIIYFRFTAGLGCNRLCYHFAVLFSKVRLRERDKTLENLRLVLRLLLVAAAETRISWRHLFRVWISLNARNFAILG